MNTTARPDTQETRPGWTPAREDRLRDLWAKGWSASEISNDIGGGLSRSAVLGKVDRLGLSQGGKTRLPRRQVRLDRNVSRAKPKPLGVPKWIEHAADRIDNRPFGDGTAAYYEPPAEMSSGISLDELTNSTCRWPFGTPGAADFCFCGAASADLRESRPYCAPHERRARA